MARNFWTVAARDFLISALERAFQDEHFQTALFPPIFNGSGAMVDWSVRGIFPFSPTIYMPVAWYGLNKSLLQPLFESCRSKN